jgi:hypothetical protein
MAKEISPYSLRGTRQARKAQLSVLAEDVESNIQDDLHRYWRIIHKHLGLVLSDSARALMIGSERTCRGGLRASSTAFDETN